MMITTGVMRRINQHLSGAVLALAAAVVLLAGCASLPGGDPLPSWNEGAAKAAIVKLVAETTREDAVTYVPPAERVATFDNDGTLWIEQPLYTEVMFTLDRIRALAPHHPEWKTTMPFKAVVDNDRAAMAKLHEHDFFKMMAVTHSGVSPATFRKLVSDWLVTARHPRFHRPYTDLVYQPMLEVLAYFRANGYKTFIVSGGTIDFIRAFAEHTYGIPPEQVVGTMLNAKYSFEKDAARLSILPEVALVDDGPGKAVGIHRNIGRVPIAAFGNSDGDLAMLETTTQSAQSRQHPRLSAFVWHTDAAREYAYDRNSHVGRLNKGLEVAPKLGWTLIDMKKDWKVIFPYELKP